MRFRYIGEEYTEWFGFKWMNGTEHDVEDAHAIAKLSNSVLFAKVAEQPSAEAVKPRLGRPRKVEADGNNQEQ